MPTEKWGVATARPGAGLGVELNGLANGAYSVVGPELDNSANLDVYGIAEMNITFAAAPVANSPVSLFAVCALDGTNYESGAPTFRFPQDSYCGAFICLNVTTPQRMVTRPFLLRPFKTKFAILNQSGQPFPATLNTVAFYTFNRTIG